GIAEEMLTRARQKMEESAGLVFKDVPMLVEGKIVDFRHESWVYSENHGPHPPDVRGRGLQECHPEWASSRRAYPEQTQNSNNQDDQQLLRSRIHCPSRDSLAPP